MKVNKLIGLEKTLDFIEKGCSFDIVRGTGRSTALALKIIGAAMSDPGDWYKIKDHHDTMCADRALLDTIQDIIDKLNFECFEFRVLPLSIRFNLFEEYERTITWRLKK